MVGKEKLREVVRAAAVQLNEEKSRIELAGSGGLSLELKIEKYPTFTWRLQSSKTDFREHIWLQLCDIDGNHGITYGSKGFAVGAFKDKERLRFELVKLADKLIDGDQMSYPLEGYLDHSAAVARIELQALEVAALKIPAARQKVEQSEVAVWWLKKIEKLPVVESNLENEKSVGE